MQLFHHWKLFIEASRKLKNKKERWKFFGAEFGCQNEGKLLFPEKKAVIWTEESPLKKFAQELPSPSIAPW